MPKADEPPVAVELKACPFCGADGELIERRNPLSKWRYSVDCSGTTCGMSGPVEATKAEAIAAWNNRTAPQPVGREAEHISPDLAEAVLGIDAAAIRNLKMEGEG